MRDEGFEAEHLPDDDGWPASTGRDWMSAVAIGGLIAVFLIVVCLLLAPHWME